MSARKMRVSLSPRARTDIRDSLRFTFRTWGPDQRDNYATAFDSALALLTEHPGIGIKRIDLDADRRSLNVNEHILYYRVLQTEIRVDRVLHRRQDASSALKDLEP